MRERVKHDRAGARPFKSITVLWTTTPIARCYPHPVTGTPALAPPPGRKEVVPTPICRFENFLAAGRADALLSYALSRQADFTAGTVMDPLTGRLSRKGRRSPVLPVHSTAFSQHLADCLPLVTEVLGMDTRPSRTTAVLTTHGLEGYFGIHTDPTKIPDPATAQSAIYYLHRRPRGLDGGQLSSTTRRYAMTAPNAPKPTGASNPTTAPSVPASANRTLLHTRVLGGVINEYAYVARPEAVIIRAAQVTGIVLRRPDAPPQPGRDQRRPPL
ncbi:hypothetical protein [Streptantibioticus ferralitis]|uniref:Uncharacterized protein n=1 Tax=Streptantibioticus ferralitis TaxID=236510 RepID=A0ABT5YVD5_9ACTN|nr:hypothetical protein [Streptantibioticus ferralitis]MDF2255551.1 hypothetical protein [Streptantibioticus ferralitis]